MSVRVTQTRSETSSPSLNFVPNARNSTSDSGLDQLLQDGTSPAYFTNNNLEGHASMSRGSTSRTKLPSFTEIHTSSPIAAGLPVLEVVKRLEEEKMITRDDRIALKDGLYSTDSSRREEIVKALCDVELSMNGRFAVRRLKAVIHQNGGGEPSSKGQREAPEPMRPSLPSHRGNNHMNSLSPSSFESGSQSSTGSGPMNNRDHRRKNNSKNNHRRVREEHGRSRSAGGAIELKAAVAKAALIHSDSDSEGSGGDGEKGGHGILSPTSGTNWSGSSSGGTGRKGPPSPFSEGGSSGNNSPSPSTSKSYSHHHNSSRHSRKSSRYDERAPRQRQRFHSGGNGIDTEQDSAINSANRSSKHHHKGTPTSNPPGPFQQHQSQQQPPRDGDVQDEIAEDIDTASAINQVVGESPMYSGPENFNVLAKIAQRLKDFFAKYDPVKMGKRKFAVLVGGGSFNPLTRMHLRTYFLAKQFLEMKAGYVVLGSLLSPAHGATVRERYRTNPKEIIPSPHRLAVAQLLVQNSKLLSVDPWEITRRRAMDYLSLLEHTQSVIKDFFVGIEIKVMYLCKPNMVPKLSPSALRIQNFAVISVSRAPESDNLRNSLGAKWNGIIHVVEDSAILDASLDVVTSRKVRDNIKAGKSVEQLVGEKINDYIIAHRIGPKMCGLEKWESREKMLPDLASRPAEPALRSQSTYSIDSSKLEQHDKLHMLSVIEANPAEGTLTEHAVAPEELIRKHNPYHTKQHPKAGSSSAGSPGSKASSASGTGSYYTPSWASSESARGLGAGLGAGGGLYAGGQQSQFANRLPAFEKDEDGY